MDLKLYNTLSRRKEVFKPIKKGRAGVYTCGPTVYDYAHIGNFRSFIFADILGRTLRKFGYKTKQILNITDVGHLVSDGDSGEDKLERAAAAEKKTAAEIASFYEKDFLSNFGKLGADTARFSFPRASEHIKEQIELVKKLKKKGFTYQTSDGIYFDTSKLKNYGKLGRISQTKLKSGARVAVNPEKKNPADFALWKFSKPGEKRQQEWPSPWGKGFPGWHIECSAMSMKYLGKHFDIHTGGIDLIPVHHVNEIAQSETATGVKFVNFWLHPNFVKIENEKMSKSLGNIITPSQVETRADIAAYRYWLLTSHYRKIANFSWEGLAAAENALRKISSHLALCGGRSGKTDRKYLNKFLKALSDDLNTPKALSVLWALIKDKKILPADKKKTILEFDEILGLGVGKKKTAEIIPPEIIKLAEERDNFRKNKEWQKSDELRAEISKLGYLIEDTPTGCRLKKK